MSSINKITLVGKGLLGSAILAELVKGGFELTLLSRSQNADENLPANVRRIAVDYKDAEALKKALQGQDAVVSTVGAEGTLDQKLLIEAAIQAGVRRFIPSDFGTLTTNPAAAQLLHHIHVVEIQKYLAAKSNEIEYTIFSVGAFTEFLVNYGLVFDWENKTSQVWGDGSSRISTTSLSSVGRAVVGALKNPEATKNKNLFIHELVVTQAQLLSLAKKYSSEAEWTTSNIENPEAEFERLQKVVGEEPTMPNIVAFVASSLLSGKFQAHYEKVDNKLVGLPLLDEKDLEATFATAYGH